MTSFSLKRAYILAKKEVIDVFSSPLVYILSALFSLIMGWLFFNYLISGRELTDRSLTQSVLIPLFGNMNFMFIFLAPLLTMKSISEEKKMHTLELLFTSHLSHLEIILAKLFSAFVMSAFMIAMTIIFPIVLSFSGYHHWEIVVTSYSGLLLCILCYLSVGLFTSSLTQNQVVAALMGFSILLGLMLLVLTANVIPNQLLAQMLGYFSIASHFESFVSGGVKSYDLFFFITFVGFFCYLTHLSLDARKW